MQKWFLKDHGKIMVEVSQVNKLALVFLEMQQKTLYIKFVKTLSLKIKILDI